MPRNEPTEVTGEWDGERSAKRRKAVRYGVPVAVAGVAAATIGLVPAFAGSGSPDLPKISAQDLIAKITKSDVQQLSGTVQVTTDLGLPSLPGGMGAGGAGGFGGGEQGRGGADGAASPQSKLTELASGTHTLRVAVDGPEKQRVSIVGNSADYTLVHNGADVWAYDSGSNSAVHHTAPRDGHRGTHRGAPEGLPKGLQSATPQELAKAALEKAGDTTSVTVGDTAKVAGRDAYQLVIKPKQTASTVGSIRVAVDAANGVPLKFTLTPKSGGPAAIDVGYTRVDFARPAADTFSFTPPKGAKVVNGDKAGEQAARQHGKALKDHKGPKDFGGLDVIGKGWTSIATVKGAGGHAGKDQLAKGDAGKFLDSLGTKVTGSFGSGHVFSTRLVNALMTDDGTVYVGAVDKQALIAAADAAKK
ncbi:outer membrane lipoprotein carrier protein LolA [Streptomyces sp. NPDC004296]|uniref:LolA family protein n=1 Tax=Streptomyces sp. NPDC004296 TaxID=3364697 RepID=UPI00369BF56E